jgi:pimeloyl-ACP methyl ester carboxylesterase
MLKARMLKRRVGDARWSGTLPRRELRLQVSPTGVIRGDLAVPSDARGLIVFAHGTGSSRRSPRNRQVAAHLERLGLATLLLDLLTEAEEEDDRRGGQLRFDIGLLAQRLELAVDAAKEEPKTSSLPVGLFGASTGAAAALVAAAAQPERIGAVVSRGGRPDLAGDALEAVRAPTLLIVGGLDRTVLRLNREAAERLRCPHHLVVVPGASHLFEEPGTLDEVARLAGDWFTITLVSEPDARP